MSDTPKKLSEDKIKNIRTEARTYLMHRWEPQPKYEPPIVVKGKGLYYWDAAGKKYIDWTSQLYNVHIGLGNRKVIEAVKKQLDELAYTSPGNITLPKVQLAKKLAEITPGDLCKTFFGNSGTEGIETAIKAAQFYKQRRKIISMWDAYHGSTYASVSAGGSARNRNYPFMSIIEEFKHVPSPYCYRCQWNQEYPGCDLQCAKWIEYIIDKEGPKSVAGVLSEPIISWAGQVIPPKEYWPMVRKICDEKDVCLMFDEVMTGFARTGKMFAMEHWNVIPDIVVFAKGISCGYMPLGATMVRKTLADYFGTKMFPHSFTWSGHAAACAAGLAVLDVYSEQDLVNNAAKMGDYFTDAFKGIQERTELIGDIRIKGLFMGVELVANRETKEFITPKDLSREDAKDPEKNPMMYLRNYIKDRNLMMGVVPGAGRPQIFRMMPPLIITKEQADEGLKIIEDGLVEMSKKFDLPRKK